jgi:anti-sigma B factor antagonist
MDTSPQLRSALFNLIRERASPVVLVDMSGVSYCDTSGIATLLEAAQLAHTCAIRLRVTGIGDEPKMLAQVAEVDQIFAALGSELEWR